MPSIKDVARLAGVSIATVSRAVNGLGVVTEETRKKIDLAIGKIGYSPNLIARSLKNKSAKLLGLLVPDIENPYYATLAKHVEVEASSAGYNLILCNTAGSGKLEAEYIGLLIGRLVDGILLCRSAFHSVKSAGENVPTVVLEKSDARDGRPTVMVDNFMVGQLIARHFLELGHRNFVCVVEDGGLFPFARRIEGFASVIDSGDARCANRIIESGGTMGKAGARDLRSLLALPRKSRPTAIYCTNDQLAFGVMQVIVKSGLSIPADVSVAGTDNVLQSSYIYPPLTTVGQPFGDIAAAAIKLILGDRAGGEGDIIVEPTLIVRQSTGPAASSGRKAAQPNRSRRRTI